jgi:leader peptidase (prepilin peptidase)/N-methyltransferase
MDVSSPAVFAHLALRAMEFPALAVVFIVLWLAIFGGSIGSFLNVVVYRLPLGLSLLYPPSRCPQCGTPILARDNLPVLGWLLLRGRCRACRAWISPRYPLVELTTTVAFLVLAFVEPMTLGWNLPLGRAVAVEQPHWVMLFYHFTLCCGLLGAGLMTFDGEAVPNKFWGFLWCVGAATAAFVPAVRPVGAAIVDRAWGPLAIGLGEGMLGALAGVIVGAASWPAASSQVRGRSGHIAAVAGLACVGTYLGYQAAAWLAVVAALAWSTWQMLRYAVPALREIPWLLFLAAGTFGWVVWWRTIVDHWPAAGRNAPWYVTIVTTAATLTIALAGRTLADSTRRRRRLELDRHAEEPTPTVR